MHQVLAHIGRWLRRWVLWPVVVLLLAASVLLLRQVAEAPAQQAAALLQQVHSAPDTQLQRLALEKDLLQYEQQKTDNWIKIGTAVVLAVGGYFAWRNLQVAQRNLKATQDKLDVDREAQITNRFTQAISQLGAELKDGSLNLEVRLGGIYALERIAKNSPKDHWTIMEVLTAYVRQNAPWPPRAWREPTPRIDIQAILTVLGRRTPPKGWPEPSALDLRSTDLRGTNLLYGRLEGRSS